MIQGQTTLTLEPIGFMRSGVNLKFDSPHQPRRDGDRRNVVELVSGKNFQSALRDLGGFSHIWLIWCFDRNSSWNPVVLPPRGPARKRGVFATRSPHRPNPIGLTVVPLFEVRGLQLIVGEVDLLEGTPILDIKPYIPSVDAIPHASSGWVGRVEETLSQPPEYSVTSSEDVLRKAEWLREQWSIDFIDRACDLLARDPSVHKSRRIQRYGEDRFRIGCGTWRIIFSVQGKEVFLESIESGYPESLVMGEKSPHVQEQDAHIDFIRRWKSNPVEE